jgi:hypothetical protein
MGGYLVKTGKNNAHNSHNKLVPERYFSMPDNWLTFVYLPIVTIVNHFTHFLYYFRAGVKGGDIANGRAPSWRFRSLHGQHHSAVKTGSVAARTRGAGDVVAAEC